MRALAFAAALALALPRPASAQPAPVCLAAAPHGAPPRAAFARALDRCMAGMHGAMAAAIRPADPGRVFAEAMIPHHQGAIDMARLLLLHGEDGELRSFALGIIAEQQAEIDLLRAWLARRPAPPRDASGAGVAETRAAPDPPAPGPAGQEAPGPIPISARDRVYTADQVSNTVSVIDPSTDRLLGQIRLGNARPDVLSPLYGGQANVHGLGFSPDGSTLAVISTATNGVTLIDLARNEVKGTVYVGRNPHEGFWTPDGRELWVTVRGESHVAVIDPVRLTVVERIETAEGPGMVVFRPDGAVAFVDHSFTPELDVVDVATRRVIRRIPVTSPFSPNLAVTLDGRELWITHKDVGRVTVIDARTFEILDVLDTGPVTNHVNFAGPNGAIGAGGATGGDFAYVTVGGENAVKVYRRSDRRLVATIPVGAVPHGLWPSGDGTRVYVGLQQADAVAVIDTRTNAQVAEIPVGQSPQALVYVPRAVPGDGSAAAGLQPPADARPPLDLALHPPGNAPAGAEGRATVRALGPVDGVEIQLSGLDAGTSYTVYLAERPGPPFGDLDPLAVVAADGEGRAGAEAYTAVRRTLGGGAGRRSYLVVLRGELDTAGRPVLVQAERAGG